MAMAGSSMRSAPRTAMSNSRVSAVFNFGKKVSVVQETLITAPSIGSNALV